jgi:RNA polymerase sigma-70 factor (ECF subfamily)
VRDAAWHDALYTEHRERIMKVLIRMLKGDIAAAEDLAQETFVTAWTKRNSVPDEPIGWLILVAKNHFLNFGRAQRRRRTVTYDGEVMNLLAPAPAADVEFESSSVRLNGFERLSKKDREILVLRHVYGLDGNEIADALGIRPATARQRLARAERRAKDLIQSGANDEMGDDNGGR